MVFRHSNRLFLGFCFSSDVLSETAPTSEMYQLPIHTEISSMEYLGFQIDHGSTSFVHGLPCLLSYNTICPSGYLEILLLIVNGIWTGLLSYFT